MNPYSKYDTICVMRKITYALLLSSVVTTAHAEINPFFSGYENQIAFNVGTGVNSGFLIPPPSQFVPYTMFQFQYSQPTTFFKLQARQSLNLIMNVGYGKKYGWHWDSYTIPIVMLSEDIILANWHDWYFYTGLGVGMQGQQNERIGSKLLFGFKLGTGYKITDCVGIELFMQHMSNGNTAPENNSYAFYGMGLTYSF